MPTDEQLREQFEVFLATWFDVYDRAMLAPKELSSLKAAFEAGHLSRDAEVQALREEVVYYKGRLRRVLDNSAARIEEVRSLDAEVQSLREALTYALHVLEHLKADNPNPLLPSARWKSIDTARAALAGGEQ